MRQPSLRRLGSLTHALFLLAAAGCASSDEGGAESSPVAPVATPPTPSVSCDGTTTCKAGRCTLATTGTSMSAGSGVTIVEKAMPSELAGDALGSIVCEVAVPSGSATQLVLKVEGAGVVRPDAAIVRWSRDDGASGVEASTVAADGVQALIARSGTYAVTTRPRSASVEAILGEASTSTEGTAGLLRNVSGRTIGSSFFDGARLFVGNGGRVLVYDGIPSSPATAPPMVLGEPDLATPSARTSAASFGGAVRAIWSDGHRLLVLAGNRILVWHTMPTASFTPADVVIGQTDFSTNAANLGGVSASSLFAPLAMDCDGTRLVVADTNNNRFLVWDAIPTASGQPASRVVGQPSFTSNELAAGALPAYITAGVALVPGGAFLSSTWIAPGAARVSWGGASNPSADFGLLEFWPATQPTSLYLPGSVFTVPGGGFGAVDTSSYRIAMFRSTPTAQTTRIDFALGAPDMSRYVDEETSASSLRELRSSTIASGAATFTVPDGARLLVWDAPPRYTFEPASRVVGQPGFTTNELGIDFAGISGETLGAPADVAVSSTMVAIADRGNNRVVVMPRRQDGGVDSSKSVVVGQPDAHAFSATFAPSPATASRTSGPAGVAFAGQRLVVADTENHRVLVWNEIPTRSGAPADLVLGQANFVGRRPNHGRGDESPVDGFSDAGADGFFQPIGVASDGERLFVSDRVNHRVLVWTTFPTANGQPADAVIGQPDMSSSRPNRGKGPSTPATDGFDLPTRIALSGSSLFVADTENNRVVRIDSAATSPVSTAFYGQPDGTTLSNPGAQPQESPFAGQPMSLPKPSSASVLRPVGVTVAGGRLYVSEAASHRVHVLDVATASTLAVLGQPDATSGDRNSGGLGARTLASPHGLASDGVTLFVADSENNRVVAHPAGDDLGTFSPASALIGQTSFFANGFDRASSPDAQTRPRGVARFGADLYVAETERHRVVVMSGRLDSGAPIARVIGPPDAQLSLANAGSAPSSSSLRSPRSVSVDEAHVVVADTGNHRVLVFPRKTGSGEAGLVLGQLDFTSAASNRGGSAGAATLSAPESVYTDGKRLVVADTGNHRVLVWNDFPTKNGQPADLVLGQTTTTGRLANRGGAASAATMAAPGGVHMVGGALYVADTGNSRVLRFGKLGAMGAAADVVLGQPDPSRRSPATDATDLAGMSAPATIADDGTHVFVADRDLDRVVAYDLTAPSGAAGTFALGLDSALKLNGPTGLAVERTPMFTSRVYIADTAASRVVVMGNVSRLRASSR